MLYNFIGLVFLWVELIEFVVLVCEYDLWFISDEVYDELYVSEWFIFLCELVFECIFMVGSVGKWLEVIGWWVGWILCLFGLGGGLSLVGGLVNVW